MELVYLWVEEYKNIYKQGFNFSPRFICKYDKEKNDLDIIDKEETKEPYLKNFFGDNINVTAIVGENGSGKSSIIDMLYVDRNNLKNGSSNYLIIFLDNGKLYSYGSIQNFNTSKKIINSSGTSLPKLINSETSYRNSINLYKLNHEVLNIEYMFKKMCNLKLINNNIFVPYYIYFYKYHKDLLNNEYLPKFGKLRLYFRQTDDPSLKEIIRKIEENDFIDATNEDLKNGFNILKKLTLHKHINKLDNNDVLWKYYEIDLDDEDTYSKLSIFQQYIPESYPIFELDLFDTEKERLYTGLSDGEKNLYAVVLHTLEILISNSTNSSTILLFDELERDLHPKWQKYIIYLLIDYIKNLKDNKKKHLIITSHSPFILSDIPKENIIFLEKGVQKHPFKDNEQTFGANIHTLLSHGFFMKDGLMGEFAKEKINEAIKYLNQKMLSQKEIEYCEDIISIVGEPILKRQLQKMLDSKRLSKIDDIEQIKEEIKRLEDRMTLIWKNSK